MEDVVVATTQLVQLLSDGDLGVRPLEPVDGAVDALPRGEEEKQRRAQYEDRDHMLT